MKAKNKIFVLLTVLSLLFGSSNVLSMMESPGHEHEVFIPLLLAYRDPSAAKTWQTLFVSPDEGDILTSLSVGRNGDIYIASKRGKLYRRSGNRVDTLLDISAEVNSPKDRGLNAVVVSPDGLYVYVLYIRDLPAQPPDSWAPRDLALKRVSLRDPSSQDILLSGLEITADTHTAGFLKFGPGGDLFVGIGDDANNESDADLLHAIDINYLYGKVLRLNPVTGGGVPSNPFWDGDPYSVRSRIYAIGFRNPFSAYYDEPSEKFYVGDVGQTEREEVNIVNPGKSYGWPCMEGTRPNLYSPTCVGYVSEPPLVEYLHYCGGAVTGVTLWRNQLLVSDYACGRIYNPIANQTVFTPSAPTALTKLSYDDLLVNQFVGTTGRYYGQVAIYTDLTIPPVDPSPVLPQYAITLTRLATNVVEGLAISQAGEDKSDLLQWDGVVHHDQHIHPDFFVGAGRVVTLERTTHPDGWVELCASLGSSTECMRLD
jgi:hypothetical protein